MNVSSFLKTMLLLPAASFLLASCVYHERGVYSEPAPPAAGTEIVVNDAPPPPVVEEVTISPGPEFVWVGGFWVWRGHWVWEHGHWARPPRAGAVWITPRYIYRDGRHIYIHGGWR